MEVSQVLKKVFEVLEILQVSQILRRCQCAAVLRPSYQFMLARGSRPFNIGGELSGAMPKDTEGHRIT